MSSKHLTQYQEQGPAAYFCNLVLKLASVVRNYINNSQYSVQTRYPKYPAIKEPVKLASAVLTTTAVVGIPIFDRS
jgi:hypothetical protein